MDLQSRSTVIGNGILVNGDGPLAPPFPLLAPMISAPQSRIAIKAKGKILLIDTADVLAVEAKGNYALVQQRRGSHLLRESISNLEEKLSPLGFVRIHRSVLVNAALVEEIQPRSTGEYVLRLDGRQYIVTRTYRKNLRLLAHSWIGACPFSSD